MPSPAGNSISNDSPAEDSALRRLLHSESHHIPPAVYLRRCRLDLTARQHSINWILKANTHHNFKPATAFLSINYLDRFLSSNSESQFFHANRWPFHLLSVACLSLAAKMEETHVPMLLDLQMLEPKFVFEPRTVRRMEVRVMAELDWRLRAVTPFDFLHCFVSELVQSGDECDRMVKDSSDLVLGATRAVDFLEFPPSVVAAAAVICAAGERVDSPVVCSGRLMVVNREMVRSCHQLMEDYLTDTCPARLRKDRRRGARDQPPPPSPVGVLDAAACGSCDTLPGEPPAKRLRSSAADVQEQ